MLTKLKTKVTHRHVRIGFDTITIFGTLLLIAIGAVHHYG